MIKSIKCLFTFVTPLHLCWHLRWVFVGRDAHRSLPAWLSSKEANFGYNEDYVPPTRSTYLIRRTLSHLVRSFSPFSLYSRNSFLSRHEQWIPSKNFNVLLFPRLRLAVDYTIIDSKKISVWKITRAKIFYSKGKGMEKSGTNIGKQRIFWYQLRATVSNKVRYNLDTS